MSAPHLLAQIREAFQAITDHRRCRQTITLTDALMSGLAVFALKCPSLLNFDEKQRETTIRHNLGTLYGIAAVPCDTQLRSILDAVNPVALEPAFLALHHAASHAGLFQHYAYLDGRVLIALDGTGHFSSHAIACPHCCIKQHRHAGPEYYHQLLGAVVVHPDYPVVIPLAPEPITKGDGATKNDCERTAAKRLLTRVRDHYGHLRPMIIEDGLASNGPHIKLLNSMGFSYILGAKPGDHEALFRRVDERMRRGDVAEFEVKDAAQVIRGYRFINQLPLNDSHPDLLVNVLEFWEVIGERVQNFSWVTDMLLTTDTVEAVMRGGRVRWHIENATFNTLKNQGYHLEDNDGHGQQYLASVFGCLTFLAFLVDQLQAWGCDLFQQARQARRTLTSLWDQMRALFTSYFIASWAVLWGAIAHGHATAPLEINNTS